MSTQTGRPSRASTRDGFRGRRPLILAPAQYDQNNEQQFRTQLDQNFDEIDLRIDAATTPLPQIYAQAYGFLTDNTAAANTTALNLAIAAAVNNGGGVVILGNGTYQLNALTIISSNSVILQGQGRFAGGTQLQFMNLTGDCIVMSGFGHMAVYDVYLTAGVNRTSGYAIKFTGSTFESEIRRIRIDYHYNGVWVDASSNCIIDTVTFRYMLGTVGVNVFGGSNPVFGYFLNDVRADNPYPVTNNGTRQGAWATSTVYAVNNIVTNNNLVWQCTAVTSDAKSANAGPGPSTIPGSTGADAFTATVLDNHVTWKFVCSVNLYWVIVDSAAYSGVIRDTALLDAWSGLFMRDTTNSGSSQPKWLVTDNMQVDHAYGDGVKLDHGSGFYCGQSWVGSSLTSNNITIGSNYQGDVSIHGGTRIVGAWQHGILLQSGPKQVRIIDNEIATNSQASVGTYHGITVAAGATDFNIIGNASGNSPDGSGQQGYGVLVSTGASDRYNVAHNLVSGNNTAGVSDNGTGANKFVGNNY